MTSPAPPHPPELPREDRVPLIPAWGFLRRNRHLTVPLAVPPAFLSAGLAAAALPQYRGDLAVASGVAAAGMHLAAPHRWDRRSEQWYARLSVAGAGCWLCVTAWTGLSEWTAAAALAGSLAWGIPWWVHKRPRSRDRGQGVAGEWNAWWMHHAPHWDLIGSGVVDVATHGPAEILRVQLWRGRQTARDVERAVPLIESALGGYVPHGGLRVARDRANPSQVLLHLRRANPLAAKPITWSPDMVPMSVREPAVIGQRETGQWRRASLLANWFVLGESRSGKSNELSLFLSALTGVPDARVWLIDRKGGRAARPWMPALDWVATTIEEARIMLGTGVAEAEARATHAYDGSEQLEPSADVPAIFLVIDETNRVTSVANGDTICANRLAELASVGQGVAMYVIVVTQYGALDESVRTEQTRGNLPNRIAFRMAHKDHGVFAIPDWQALDTSKLAEPGTFYCKLGPDAPAEPHRAPHIPHVLAEQIAKANGAMPRQPLRLYASHLQAEFDARWLRLPEPFRKLAPQYLAAVIARAGGSPSPATEAAADPAGDADVLAIAPRLARIEADVASVPDLASLAGLDLPSEADLRGEMQRRWLRFARDLMSAGGEGVSPDQLVTHTGLSRSSVHGQLRDLTSEGAVTKLAKGKYRAAPGVNTWDAMESLRAGRERLLASAPA